MKLKKEYIILILIIIGLTVYLFVRKTDRTLYELPALPQVSKKDISKIEITKGAATIVLTKKDDHWYIGTRQYAADKNKINAMLDVFEKLTLTALVSESKNYVRYELNDAQKITVSAWQGETLLRAFDIGKTAASFRHTFVKLADDDRVYHARDSFRTNFDQSVDNLREKTVLSFQTIDIEEIQIVNQQHALTFTRTLLPPAESVQNEDAAKSVPVPPAKTVWKSADGKSADDASLNRLLVSLSALRCEKFIDDRTKEDFSTPLYAVQLKGSHAYNLAIYSKLNDDDSNYPATSSASDYPFFLPSATANSIMKDPNALLKAPENKE